MAKALVIYHREDNDGLLSGAILYRYIEMVLQRQYPDMKLSVKPYGVNYAELTTLWQEHEAYRRSGKDGSQFNKWSQIRKWDLNYDYVIMTDISFNEVEAMNFMYENWGDHFIWCDHHAPIIKQANDHIFGSAKGLRDTQCSAILCAWRYTHPDVPAPDDFVRLSDYDSWQWVNKEEYKTPEGKDRLFAFNTGVTRSSNLKFQWFLDLLDRLDNNPAGFLSCMYDCQSYGELLLGLDYERTDRAINSHGDTSWTFNGEKACVLFTTDRFNSDSFVHAIAGNILEPDTLHGITFKREKDGRWILSAYNTAEDLDTHCGEYLKFHYNGGGHKGAAGCTLSEDQVIEMLKTHKI